MATDNLLRGPTAFRRYGCFTTSAARPSRHAVLKQERARATRQRLLDAAIELIRLNGYDATKASDISARAGVAEGTFFFHFPRKGDLLVELGLRTSRQSAEAGVAKRDEKVSDTLDRVAASVGRRVQRIPRDLVVHTVLELYRRAGEWPELRTGDADFQAIFRRIYETAIERNELPGSIDLDEIATLLSGATLHAILLWAQGQRGEQTLETLLRGRIALIHAGVVATARTSDHPVEGPAKRT